MSTREEIVSRLHTAATDEERSTVTRELLAFEQAEGAAQDAAATNEHAAWVRQQAARTRTALDQLDNDHRDVMTLIASGELVIPGLDEETAREMKESDLVRLAFTPPPPAPTVAQVEKAPVTNQRFSKEELIAAGHATEEDFLPLSERGRDSDV